MNRQTTEQHFEFEIEGMSCASCVSRIEHQLKKIVGVKDAEVNLTQAKAWVITTPELSADLLIERLGKAGYKAVLIPKQPYSELQLHVTNMSCASCVGRVERLLNKQAHIHNAQVNLATETATLHVDQDVQIETILAALNRAGYPATLPVHQAIEQPEITNSIRDKHALEQQTLKRDVYLASLLTLPVFIIEMGAHLIPAWHHWISHYIGLQHSWYFQFALCTLLLMTAGQRFYRSGIPALLRGAPDMNSLVALGTLAAYGYSVVATFASQWLPAQSVNVYYESAMMIISLILLGRYLESRAKGKTSQAIHHLLNLQPQHAHLVQADNIVDIPTIKLQRNDIVLIKPGERIPADGVVIQGNSYIDESMMTGEAVPIAKKATDNVIGGTVNQHGSLHVRISAIGQDMVLSQIVKMVEKAQGSKLPIQTLVDKITLWFVPVIMLLALLTFLMWYFLMPSASLSLAVVNAVAVLIIACPCAMGLATPTSIMVGTGRAAELGILFKHGEALQLLKDVKVIAFDKTGTLTQGKPVLTDFIVKQPEDQARYLQLAISLELKSEHPIAKALSQVAQQQNISPLPIEDFQALAGYGVQGSYQGQALHLGAQRFMQQLDLDIDEFFTDSQNLEQQGKTPLYFSINHQVKAVIAVADNIKAESKLAIQLLQQQGLQLAMISGDNHITAQHIAQQLGIQHVIAEVLPEQKVATLKQLKQQFGRIAFVGDGINDAPALAYADVGLAIGTGTDIAMESADIVLMSGNIQGVHHALALSQGIMRNIQQNLFWAFAYNIALIPVAMGILYPLTGWLLSPMFAAAAMAMSSVFVLTNALRLRHFQPH